MQLKRLLTAGLVLCSLLLTVNAFPSEIGFSVGSSSQASDFAQPLEYDYQDIVNTTVLDPEMGAEISSELHPLYSGGSSFGHRSGAAYLGFILVNDLPVSGFELEHDIYATFGAQESIKKHSLAYAANLNYLLPWYPEIAIWRMKPFVGAGAGYAYNFGTKKNSYFTICWTTAVHFSSISAAAPKSRCTKNGGCAGQSVIRSLRR